MGKLYKLEMQLEFIEVPEFVIKDGVKKPLTDDDTCGYCYYGKHDGDYYRWDCNCPADNNQCICGRGKKGYFVETSEYAVIVEK